jgi:hypothetical protein
MPACYLAAHDHGRLAARNCRAAVARLTRPGKNAGTRGALPQPRVTGIKRFLRCRHGRQTASGMGKTSGVRTVSAVHQAPKAGKFRGTTGVWSSTTTSLTDATQCGLVYHHCCRTNLANAPASSSNAE